MGRKRRSATAIIRTFDWLTAGREACYKVRTSLGVCNAIVQFLTQIEALKLQASSKFAYEVMVGRSQSRIEFNVPWLLAVYEGSKPKKLCGPLAALDAAKAKNRVHVMRVRRDLRKKDEILSAQVGRIGIFEVNVSAKTCQILKAVDGHRQLQASEVAEPLADHCWRGSSLCVLAERFAFLSGGKQGLWPYGERDVQRFDF